ncbi:hypothetical protein EJB05_49553, partial [Eragrostis curvula]
MGFSEAVQWWEEWQLRILVLTSLFIQYFLLLTATLRKFRVWPWLRFLTWLAYLASDAMAVYALATLFNRHRKQEWVSKHRSNASLEALWAPILLLHLGGQDSITAYNIEDNELWSRHLLTAVTQITVAIYVFRKSWSGDKRLLQAAILIFVPGVLKCMEKPFALKSASINSIVSTSGPGILGVFEEKENVGKNINSLEEYIRVARTHVREVLEEEQSDREALQEEQSDQEAREEAPSDHEAQKKKPSGNKLVDKPYLLFLDGTYPYSIRLMNLRSLVGKKAKAHNLVRSGLSRTFDRLYTKEEMYKGLDYKELNHKSIFGLYLRGIVVYLTYAAIGLFHKSNREAYNETDVMVTYILICCTAALEHISSGIKSRPPQGLTTKPKVQRNADIKPPSQQEEDQWPWPEQVAQYNLIGYLARNQKRKRLRKLLFFGRDYIDQHWCMKPCKSSKSITELVHDHVIDGWLECITDTVTYRKFNNNRGQRTLEREKCEGSLVRSLQRPFDESVIIWHLATDFCFYEMDTIRSPSHEDASCCRVMSNYMAYLLFVNPDMLIPGARRSLFKNAYDEIKKIVEEKPSTDGTKSSKTPAPSEEELIPSKIIEKMKGANDSVLVRDAWVLAQELRVLEKQKMWRVIRGVWVEMLCFSAGRCKGYIHAKSLGKGGEYLSYVWLLLSYMGMETMAERMQRTELEAQGDVGASGPTSTPLETTPGDNA